MNDCNGAIFSARRCPLAPTVPRLRHHSHPVAKSAAPQPPHATHQVDEASEVLLDVLGRQPTHEVERAVELLVGLQAVLPMHRGTMYQWKEEGGIVQ